MDSFLGFWFIFLQQRFIIISNEKRTFVIWSSMLKSELFFFEKNVRLNIYIIILFIFAAFSGLVAQMDRATAF